MPPESFDRDIALRVDMSAYANGHARCHGTVGWIPGVH